jgi:4-hydroxybenzoate polyprenyltransferase
MKTHDTKMFLVTIIFSAIIYALGGIDKKELQLSIVIIILCYILIVLCRIYNKLNDNNKDKQNEKS